jgi:TP901 family phage tail tape measure protein
MANLIVGALRVVLSLDSADYDQAIVRVGRSAGQIQKNFRSFGRQATTLGQTLTLGLTLPLVGMAKEAIETGTTFESAINQIKGVLEPTAAEMDTVRQTAIKLGADTVFSATDAANAMLELGKAGFDTQNAIQATGDVLQLAAASGLSMGDAATMAARTLNAFGLKTADLAHVNDVLAAAVNKSSLEIGDLQVAFGYVAPIATSFHLSIEQTSAALAIMRDRGIAAETTGRALREGFSRLVNPVKSVQQVMDQLGIDTFRTADGGMMDLSDIIGTLHDRGLTAGQALKLFGNAAGPGMYALVSTGAPALDQFAASLHNSQGAAKDMADAMMSGLPGAAERMRGSIETAWLSVSKAIEPTVTRVMGLIGDLADVVTNQLAPAFQALPGPAQTFAIALAGMAMALPPLMILVGQFSLGVSAIAGFFAEGTIGATVLATTLEVLTGPIGWVVLAVAALGAAWHYWGDDIEAVVESVYTSVKDWLVDKLGPVFKIVEPLFESFGKLFETLGKLAVAVGKLIVDQFIAVQMKKWQELMDFLTPIFKAVSSLIGAIPDELLPLLGPIGDVILAWRHWDEIVTIAKSVYDGVKTWLLDNFKAIVDGIKAQVDKVTGFFQGLYDDVIGHSSIPDLVNGVSDWMGQLGGVMVNPTRDATTQTSGLFDSLMTTVKDRLSSGFGQMIDVTKLFRDGFVGVLNELKSTALSIVDSLIQVLTNKLVSGFTNAIGLTSSVAAGAGASAGAGGASTAGGAAAAGAFGSAATIGAEFAFPILAGHLVNPGPLVTPPVPEDQARAAAEAYFGPDYERYAGPDFDWTHVYPGQIPGLADGGIVMPTPGGTIARLGEAGVPEAVIPLDDDSLGGTAIIQVEGRTLAEIAVPFIPGVVRRYRLA